MKKIKKLFHYENDTINPKDLEHDLKLAEDLIEKLRKVDPLEERFRRKQAFLSAIGYILLSILFFAVFFAGISVGITAAESMHHYIVSTGFLLTPLE